MKSSAFLPEKSPSRKPKPMIRAEIIAVGRMKQEAHLALWQNYKKRLGRALLLHEIEAKSPKDEEKKIQEKIKPGAFVIAMDERGKTLSSKEFAGKIAKIATDGATDIQFIIGGADGLAPSIRERADFILSFGKQTWPHMLARIMLIEQIYRAQKILDGHPYHRE